MGLKAVDLLGVEEWDVPHRYGLICSMGYAGGGDIPHAMNRVENHAKIEEAFRKNILIAAKWACPTSSRFPEIAWHVRRRRREEHRHRPQQSEKNRPKTTASPSASNF